MAKTYEDCGGLKMPKLAPPPKQKTGAGAKAPAKKPAPVKKK